MRGPLPVFQGFPQRVVDREDVALHRRPLDLSLAIAVPVMEDLVEMFHQSIADQARFAAGIDQSVKVAFQVSPTDLPPPVEGAVSAIAVGPDDATEVLPEQVLNDRGGARQSDREDGVDRRCRAPQPRLVSALLHRGFVARHDLGGRQRDGQFLVVRREGFGRAPLQLDHQTGAGRDAEERRQHPSRPALGLPAGGHQQCGQGNQSRLGRVFGNVLGQVRTGRLTAAAGQSMPLIFDDRWPGKRHFPHLMTLRLDVVAAQSFASTPKAFRLKNHALVALLDGDQRSLVPDMARLPAAIPLRRGRRAGVRHEGLA